MTAPTNTTPPVHPTARIVNRHIARLMTDLETLGCSAEIKNTVRDELRWLRDDLTKDAATDYAKAVRFYKRNVCHLLDEPQPVVSRLARLFGCAENKKGNE
jgi:hypothetical protein